MNIIVLTRGGRYFTQEHYTQLKREAEKYNFNLLFSCAVANTLDFEVTEKYDSFPSKVDLILSYGGDGTFLGSVREIEGRDIPILGVNSGHLGFLATVSSDDIDKVFKALEEGDYTIEERSMIAIKGDFGTIEPFPMAFNEFTIQKDGMNMINISLWVDGKFVARYMADGIIISTPSGSTAYSLSVGGAILAPSCSAFIITPIATHNLNIRPLVIPDSSLLEIEVSSASKRALATLDNRTYYIGDDMRFTLSRATSNIKIVKLAQESFFDTLRKKMMWGIDARKC